MLFFDEADALFGKRSEVSDARDRYANVEVAYLLQRMETFDGLGILATNLKTNLDEAFARRLSMVVDFPDPDAGLRLALWEQFAQGACEPTMSISGFSPISSSCLAATSATSSLLRHFSGASEGGAATMGCSSTPRSSNTRSWADSVGRELGPYYRVVRGTHGTRQ